MKKFLFALFAVALPFLFPLISSAQKKGIQNLPTTRILFVFDGSNSMYGYWNSDQKMTIARKLLIELIDSLEQVPNVEMALRVYGHQSPVPPQDCNDTKLEVPFGKNNAGMIRQKLRWIDPKGTTPIARSLELSAGDFPTDANARNIIILITDGIEACEGDPCAVSRALQKKGVALKPFIIGIGLDVDFTETFKCVGKVFNAQEESQFKEALKVAIDQALNATTVQINLLDSYEKPTETNVPLSFYDKVSGQIKYNYIHTLNSKGRPDTLVLDPLITYKMVAHTIPPVTIQHIELEAGKHKTFSVDAPQGALVLKHPRGNMDKELQYIIKRSGSDKIINVQKAEMKERYICGKYDVEILCLPRITLKGVQISQSETTTLRIPQPGMLTVLKSVAGYGAIFLEEKNKLEFVISLNPDNSGSETFILQPGSYRLVYRAENAKEALYTIEKRFKINSNGVEHIKLN